MSYPSLPPVIKACTLREPWSLAPVDPLRRTPMDDGATAVERKFSRLPGIYSIVFEVDGAQYDVLVDFWRRELDAGANWFYCPIVEGMRERVQVVRMFDGPFQATSPAQGVFRYTWQAEVKDIPALTQGERIAVDTWLLSDRDIDDVTAALAPVEGKLAQVLAWL